MIKTTVDDLLLIKLLRIFQHCLISGHYYAIGECGGATEVSRCPDCRAEIGGTGHALLRDNRLGSEMDGAPRSAYEFHHGPE